MIRTGNFERQVFTYLYDNIITVKVQGGETLDDIAIDAKAFTRNPRIEDMQQLIQDAQYWALEQWEKARAAYYEEAAEQELADRIARNRGEI